MYLEVAGYAELLECGPRTDSWSGETRAGSGGAREASQMKRRTYQLITGMELDTGDLRQEERTFLAVVERRYAPTSSRSAMARGISSARRPASTPAT